MGGGQSSGFSWVPPQLGGGEGTGEVHPSTPCWGLAQKAASKCPRAGGAGWGRVWLGRAGPGMGAAPRGVVSGRRTVEEDPLLAKEGLRPPQLPGLAGARPVAAEQLRNLFS